MAASEGVDLEWAIVESIRARNATTPVQAKKTYSSKILNQAEKCVEHIIKKLGENIEAWHSDENIPGVGSIYAKPEPKTDIVLITSSKKYFVSVKMAGGIQLASGQGASTAELFEAAAGSLTDQNAKKVLLSIIDELKTMPTRLLSSKNIGRIQASGNKKLIDEFISNGKVVQDRSYDLWLKNNKPALVNAILDFAQKNTNFMDALIYEAMTGKKTLTRYKGAAADSIISPSGFYMIDDSYVTKIRSKVKMDLRAKSRGGISSVAFRIETRGSV